MSDFPYDAEGKRRTCSYCDRGAFMLVGMSEKEPRCLHHLQGANSLSADQRRVAEMARRARENPPERRKRL